MALNVTIDGFASLASGSLGNADIKYQAYFYKGTTSSSNSKWNDVRTVENTGYFSCNLGDADFLGQTGTALSGSSVVVVFWKGGTRLGTDCSTLVEWGTFYFTIDGSDTYTNPAQVKSNIIPILSWSFPSTGFVGTSYNSTNSSSDIHSWVWSGTTMRHIYSYNGEQIFSINTIDNTSYDWDDGFFSNGLSGAAVGSHSWTSPGNYTVEIVIEDGCGATVSGTDIITIKHAGPSPQIICHQTTISGGNTISDPDTVVTFEYTGTNPDSIITGIEWVINDAINTTFSGSVGSTVSHVNGAGTSWYGHVASSGAFTDPGVHSVDIIVNWFDGFNNQQTLYSENFTQEYFSGPTVDFHQVPDPVAVNVSVDIINDAIDSDSRVGTAAGGVQYDWIWDDDGTTTNVNNVAVSYNLTQTALTDNVDITLSANWNDGWSDQVTSVIKALAIDTTINVIKQDCYYNLDIYGTSGDGTVDSYNWIISRSTTFSGTGPWEVVWESPIDLDQKTKSIAFTEANYFKIEGFVNGTGATTSDSEIINIDVVCEVSTECELVVWNGTGILDTGGDWTHSGAGVESSDAMRTGTNGLNAEGLSNGSIIDFTDSATSYDITEYDLLSMWVNIKSWQNGKKINIGLSDLGVDKGKTLKLSNYANTGTINEWQRVLINIKDFKIPGYRGTGTQTFLNGLTFTSTGNIDIHMDDISFAVGTITKTYVSVPDPSMYSNESGLLTLEAEVIGPSIKNKVVPFPKPRLG